jgi:hypothetical protein
VAQVSEADSVYRVVVRRALAAGDPANLQVHFDAEVLQRYREQSGVSIIRTDTVGRVRKQGAWSLDFGIAPDETSLHVPYGTLSQLPEGEREHWAQFALIAPSSRMFLQMRLAPAACHDDGEVRSW